MGAYGPCVFARCGVGQRSVFPVKELEQYVVKWFLSSAPIRFRGCIVGRIRTIKPEFWSHDQLSELPEATHILAAALLNYADDEGCFLANPKLVQANTCPLREPSVSIQCSLTELARIGFIELGVDSRGRELGRVVNFSVHQRVNRPTPSKYKDIPITWGKFSESSVSPQLPLSESSVSPQLPLSEPSLPEGNREGNREGEQGTGSGEGEVRRGSVGKPTARKKFIPPTYEQADEYFRIYASEQDNPRLIDARKFVDHHQSRGWKFKGGGPVVDWKAAARTWYANENQFSPQKKLKTFAEQRVENTRSVIEEFANG